MKDFGKDDEIPESEPLDEEEISRKGHRLREKAAVRENGLANRYEHSVLEFLLFYCIPRRDTKPIAYELINKFGNLFGVFNAPYELLEQTDGIGKDAATFLRALGEVCERYNDESGRESVMPSVDGLLEYMRRIVVPNVEACYVINTSNKDFVISVEKVMEGVSNALDIPHRLILKAAMDAHARRAIVLHNHPSGRVMPSEKDIAQTFSLNTFFSEANIELVDHLVVYETYAYSMITGKVYKHNWRLR